MAGCLKSLFILFLTPALLLAAVDPIPEAPPSVAPSALNEGQVKDVCEEITAKRELRVFKDPSLFLPNLAALSDDPKAWSHLMRESPLLTTLKGRVSLRMGEAREFKNFGDIARLYEAADPRLRLREKQTLPGGTRMIPVQLCSDGSWGFVLQSDLKQASLDEEGVADDVMPPSTYPNPIPRWRELKSRDAQK